QFGPVGVPILQQLDRIGTAATGVLIAVPFGGANRCQEILHRRLVAAKQPAIEMSRVPVDQDPAEIEDHDIAHCRHAFPCNAFEQSVNRPRARFDVTPLSSLPTAYLAAPGFLGELAEELGPRVERVHGGLLLAAGPPRPAAWAANVWLDPQLIPVA